MKKILKRTIAGACASLMLLTSSVCVASGAGNYNIPVPLISDELSYQNLCGIYMTISNYYYIQDINNKYSEMILDMTHPDPPDARETMQNYWMSAYFPYEEVFDNHEPVYDKTNLETKLIIPMLYGTNADDIRDALDKQEFEPNANRETFEFLNLTDENTFRTGSIIRYKGEDADKYPFDIKVTVYGDVTGGEDGLGDGKVDISDVVKMRSIIVNNQGEALKEEQYLVYKAFTCLEWNGTCDISHVVAARSMIVNEK